MVLVATNIALVAVGVSILLAFYRVVAGPTIPDRAVALDTIGTNIVAMMVLLSIKFSTLVYYDAVLVIAILSFVGTVAIAKYLIRGVIIDRRVD